MRIAAVLAALLAAGCSSPAELGVRDARVGLPAAPGRPGVAYLTITGGREADTLLSVRTPGAIRSELHQSAMQGGMMTMRPVRDIPVPAGATVTLRQGGLHVMLFDMNPALRPGGTVKLTLAFASGRRLDTDARITAPGDPHAH